MSTIITPLGFEELKTKPPLSPQVRLSEDMQQTLALLAGFDGVQRHLIRTTPTGIIQVVNPLIQAIINHTSTGGNEAYQHSPQRCSEVIVRANPNNGGDIWLNVGAAAGVDTGWVLDANEQIPITVANLAHIQLLIVTSGDKVQIIYTQ